MNWVLIILGILVGLVMLVILLGVGRSWQVQGSSNQRLFLQGRVPSVLPDGFYRGSVGSISVPWQGKKFDRKKSTGINIFLENGKRKEEFSFKTYVGQGVQDKNLQVLKIDYSENTSPWWLTYILDEVVEVAPGKYLGKVHITIIPGLPFTMGYFRLEK